MGRKPAIQKEVNLLIKVVSLVNGVKHGFFESKEFVRLEKGKVYEMPKEDAVYLQKYEYVSIVDSLIEQKDQAERMVEEKETAK